MECFPQEVSQWGNPIGKNCGKNCSSIPPHQPFLDDGTSYLSVASTLACTGRTSPWPTGLPRSVTVALANFHFAKVTVKLASST